MKRAYYVTAQELHGINRYALLCGPFERQLDALMMVKPVRKAMNDPNLAVSVRIVTRKPFPRGSLPLTLLDPAEVIAASRRNLP